MLDPGLVILPVLLRPNRALLRERIEQFSPRVGILG
jgi:hypothetical protein